MLWLLTCLLLLLLLQQTTRATPSLSMGKSRAHAQKKRQLWARAHMGVPYHLYDAQQLRMLEWCIGVLSLLAILGSTFVILYIASKLWRYYHHRRRYHYRHQPKESSPLTSIKQVRIPCMARGAGRKEGGVEWGVVFVQRPTPPLGTTVLVISMV